MLSNLFLCSAEHKEGGSHWKFVSNYLRFWIVFKVGLRIRIVDLQCHLTPPETSFCSGHCIAIRFVQLNTLFIY